MKVKQESEKVGLKLNNQKTKIMANRWRNNGNSETLFSWAPKLLKMVIAAMKLRCLLLGRKTMTNLDSILKCRDVSLPTKVHLVRYGFPCSHVWMWELDYKESWVPKNWCLWTVVLEKTGESVGTARRSSQSFLKEISPGCSLEGLMLKLKLQ